MDCLSGPVLCILLHLAFHIWVEYFRIARITFTIQSILLSHSSLHFRYIFWSRTQSVIIYHWRYDMCPMSCCFLKIRSASSLVLSDIIRSLNARFSYPLLFFSIHWILARCTMGAVSHLQRSVLNIVITFWKVTSWFFTLMESVYWVFVMLFPVNISAIWCDEPFGCMFCD